MAGVGTGAYLYGGLLNNSNTERDDLASGWPTANYVIDGVPGGVLNVNAPRSSTYVACLYRGVPNALF